MLDLLAYVFQVEHSHIRLDSIHLLGVDQLFERALEETPLLLVGQSSQEAVQLGVRDAFVCHFQRVLLEVAVVSMAFPIGFAACV